MESKKRLRRTIIWKRSNRSKRIQWKRDSNNNNNAEMGSSSKWEYLNPDLFLDVFSLFKPLFLISTVSLVCRSSGRVCFDHLFGEDGDNTLHFTILNRDCCWRLFGSKVTLFKKAFRMKFLRGVMEVYRRYDDDDEDGIRVTSITRMVFPCGLLQLTDHHLLYLAERKLRLWPRGRQVEEQEKVAKQKSEQIASLMVDTMNQRKKLLEYQNMKESSTQESLHVNWVTK